jgi:hypothetical protein
LDEATYAKLALRIGAASRGALQEARARRARAGGTLEEHLLAAGVLDRDLAAFVRAAWVRARALCRRCERRTDLSRPVRGERPCACPPRERRPAG